MGTEERKVSLRISETDRINFETLCTAVKNDDAGLIVVFDELTQREEVAVAVFSRRPDDVVKTEDPADDVILILPFAILFSHEAAFSRLRPPDETGESYAPLDVAAVNDLIDQREDEGSPVPVPGAWERTRGSVPVSEED